MRVLRARGKDVSWPDAPYLGDVTAFTETAIELLDSLHEGSIARYGLRPSQFGAWRARMDDSAHDEPRT